MMKILFFLFMMLPLSFFCSFWFIQLVWFLMVFMFIILMVPSMGVWGVSYDMGLDIISFCLVLLSFWICSLMILASVKIYFDNNWSGLFNFFMIFLMISLYFTFSSLNLLVFYIFFEVSLVPVLFLIIGWGNQPERLQAGLYLIFYTLFASLPMLVSLFYCYDQYFSMNYFFFFPCINSFYIYIFINFVFFVKIPMFFVHLWLPKAHVEAPISGSMILAGIMLKLGGYGMIRLMVMFLFLGVKVNFFFVGLSLVGGFYVSLVCFCQSDIKALIAYSSVSHMSLVLSGIMTLSYWGFSGSLIMMVAHGLCSSGLFCLANISYERLGTRSLYMNKGLINIVPSFSLVWFLLLSSNMASPPSMNLLGEIVLINSILSFNSLTMLFLAFMSFFGAVYSLFLYSFTQHGAFYSGLYSCFTCFVREYLLLFLHWIPLNLLFLISSDLFYI